MSALDAKALVAKGDELFEAGNHEAAFAAFDEVVDRFGDSAEEDVRGQVALALLRKGFDLGKLERLEDAVVVYEAAMARFPTVEDNPVGGNVSQALLNRGLDLRALGRDGEALAAYNDIVARYGRCTRRSIRRRVSWALWNASNVLDDLDRSEEAELLYDAIVARADDDFAPDFIGNLAWCLEHIATRPGTSYVEQLRLFTDLVKRVRKATDLRTRRSVSRAMRMRAWLMGRCGSREEEIALYDEAAAAFAEAEEPELRREALETLFWKGDALWRSDRYEEAVIVFDNVVAAYKRLGEDGDERSLASTTCAIAYAAATYGFMGSTALTETPATLAAMLGDVADETLLPSTPERSSDWEEELAADVAETLGGDCWLTFAASDGGEDERTALAMTAVDIYHRTEAVISRDAEEWDTPAFAAAILLRSVADGYALLSALHDEQARARLPLPGRPFTEWGVRLLGLDKWAAEHGHPLRLREEAEEIEKLLDEERTRVLETPDDETESHATRLARAFATLAAHYDLFDVLCRSSRGRAVRRDERLVSLAVWHVSVARQWVLWARGHAEETQGAAVAMQFMAQAAFVATHAHDVDGSELFPGRSLLRTLVHGADAYDWLVKKGTPLPAWLLPEDDELE
ncbi:MAG: tetratricopeptide repeat protein [Gaiellaceae bacterium]